jgi:hypothetical protein
MATQFNEVLPNRGVDDKVAIPQMIVPLKGTNDILLIDGDGFDVKAENPVMLEITEDKKFERKDRSSPHKFRLKVARALPGGGGLLVEARRGKTVAAKLRVFVLDNRKVRLAVRPLQTAKGVNHAKKLPDTAAFVSKMNKIWTPQANVLIELVPSNPALIDDPDQNARDLGAFEKDHYTPDTKKGVFPASIPMETYGDKQSFAPVFLSYLGRDPVKNTDFTLFVVHAIWAGSGHTFGATDKSNKFALVSEDADARQWAHELGHHLGGSDSTGKGELMESGEGGEKIPVQDAVKVFNPSPS